MPVVNNSQARIELSEAQVLSLIDVLTSPDEGGTGLPPVLFIEETNLGNTVAVGGKGGIFKLDIFLAYSGGEVHELKKV